MLNYSMQIQKFENRELSLKEFNPKTGFILYNLKVPQAVEINLKITPAEIEWLYKTSKKIRNELLKKETK